MKLVVKYSFMLLFVLSYSHLAKSESNDTDTETVTWKTDLMGDCTQEQSNKMDTGLGKIFCFSSLKIPLLYDFPTAYRWCK